VAGRTVTLKVRFGDFRTITRSTTLGAPLDSGRRLARIGRELLATVDPSSGVRLVGIGVSQLGGGDDHQLSLDDLLEPDRASEADWDEAEEAIDAVRARFGPTALGPASLTGPAGLRVAERGQQQWGPDEGPDAAAPPER
jgi:DNA polymerase-4